jgi:hypothetical protein
MKAQIQAAMMAKLPAIRGSLFLLDDFLSFFRATSITVNHILSPIRH